MRPLLKVLTIAFLILPLAMDTFVLGTSLGAAGISRRERLRTTLILSAFEAGMPVIGFLAGSGIGSAIGRWADYFAAAFLAALGAWVLRQDGEAEEAEQKVRLLDSARGWTVVLLGLSVSVDELAIGFGVGLLRLPLPLLVGLIAVQAFLAAQLGMRLGSHLTEMNRQYAVRLAGAFLVLAAVLVVAEKLVQA